MRVTILAGALFLLFAIAGAQVRPYSDQFPPTYVPSGATLYRQFCASCHGPDAKGHGPSAVYLKTPPANLTTLAKRHGGKFPYDYLSSVLQFGVDRPTHGTSEMPVWGPIFRLIDKVNEDAGRRRIQNLSGYLVSLQQK